MTRMRIGAVAAVAMTMAVGFPATSRAGFVIDFVGTTDEAGGTRYTYDVELVDDAVVLPGGAADFFTLYDLFGFRGLASVARTGLLLTDFAVSSSGTGLTAVNTTPDDDPALPNLTFTFTGAEAIDPGEDGMKTFLGTFSFLSVGGVPGFDFFTGQATKDRSGRPLSVISEEVVPGPAGPGGGPIIPEPGTLGLLAMGGLGLLGTAAHKRRKAAETA